LQALAKKSARIVENFTYGLLSFLDFERRLIVRLLDLSPNRKSKN
jgi:hypothetical protein